MEQTAKHQKLVGQLATASTAGDLTRLQNPQSTPLPLVDLPDPVLEAVFDAVDSQWLL